MKNNQKIFAIIQARMGSSRLPGKVMKEVNGIPLLKILVERIKDSKIIDGIIVATTTNPKDDILEEYCKKNNINVFRGSENDLAERILFAAEAYDADVIVEQGVDCPLVDAQLIDSALEFYYNHDFDHVTTLNNKRLIPDGYFSRICSTKLLEEVYNNTRGQIKDGELGLFYIENSPDLYRVGNFIPGKEVNLYCRLTVDEEKDLQLVKLILENFNSIKVPMAEIISFLKKNPDLLLINKGITHTENFLYKVGIFGDVTKNLDLINDKVYKPVAKYKFAGFRFTSICDFNSIKNLNLRFYENYENMLEKESLDILIILNKDNIKDYDKLANICKSKNITLFSNDWKSSDEINKDVENFIINKHISSESVRDEKDV